MNCSTSLQMAHRHRPATSDYTSMSFGARMRHERERRKISIASIAEGTKILGALLEGLENDDVSRWPTGFYRRAFMRAYATAIGLDPEQTVKEFVERFPDPEAAAPQAPAATGSGASTSAPPLHPAAPAPTIVSVPAARSVRVETPPLGAWFSPGAVVQGFRAR